MRVYKLGNVLLSHTLVYSIIGDGDLDFCVRDGNRYCPSSKVTKKKMFIYLETYVFKWIR